MKTKYKILLPIFLILMILSIISLISWSKENKNTQEIRKKEEKHLIKEKNITILDNAILKDNPDTVAWIKIYGTNINYPVVQYKDNEYYLNHDFNKETNSTGWIFMDYQNKENDQNIVIYGHHRRDNSMFGSIDLLFNPKFYQENKNEIILIRENKEIKYKIFSVYKTSITDEYNFINTDNFADAVKKLQKKSEIYFNEKANDTKQIITLSTCHNNNKDRLVVHGLKK